MKQKATQTTGKQGELHVIGELLKKGHDVYLPVTDIHGIDCVLKTSVGYKEVQIKTREKITTSLLFDVKDFEPKESFFIICYNINEPETYWVLPSGVFKKEARPINHGEKLRLVIGGEDSKMRQKLHYYRDNFFQLKEGTDEAARELRETVKTSGWAKLKELYPNVGAVNVKLAESKSKGYSEGYIRVLVGLRDYWEKHPQSP